MDEQKTSAFELQEPQEQTVRQKIKVVSYALMRQGYDPVKQMVKYILREDPDDITTYNNARAIMRQVDRNELLHLNKNDVRLAHCGRLHIIYNGGLG